MIINKTLALKTLQLFCAPKNDLKKEIRAPFLTPQNSSNGDMISAATNKYSMILLDSLTNCGDLPIFDISYFVKGFLSDGDGSKKNLDAALLRRFINGLPRKATLNIRGSRVALTELKLLSKALWILRKEIDTVELINNLSTISPINFHLKKSGVTLARVVFTPLGSHFQGEEIEFDERKFEV